MKENNKAQNIDQVNDTDSMIKQIVSKAERPKKQQLDEQALIRWIRDKMDILANNPSRFLSIKWKVFKVYAIVAAYDYRTKQYRIWRYDIRSHHETEV